MAKRFYLVHEGLLDSSRRGVWSLTERGRATTLTDEQARAISLRRVRISRQQRRAKSSGEETGAEQDAASRGAPGKDYRAEAIELLRTLPLAGFERFCSPAALTKSGGWSLSSMGWPVQPGSRRVLPIDPEVAP